MQIQRVDNTKFKGFEYRNMYAAGIFEQKLDSQAEPLRTAIKTYLKKTENEPVTVFLDATKSKSHTKEHVLLATFSNNNNLVVEKARTPKENRFKEFINRCAAEAGFEPFSKPENPSLNISA